MSANAKEEPSQVPVEAIVMQPESLAAWMWRHELSYRINSVSSGRSSPDTIDFLVWDDKGIVMADISSDLGYGIDIPLRTREDVQMLCAVLRITLKELSV